MLARWVLPNLLVTPVWGESFPQDSGSLLAAGPSPLWDAQAEMGNLHGQPGTVKSEKPLLEQQKELGVSGAVWHTVTLCTHGATPSRSVMKCFLLI